MKNTLLQSPKQALSHSALYDPELPTAADVLASISCVSAQFAVRPNLDLAKLAATLAYKLSAPEYNESCLIAEVAKRLVCQWADVVRTYEQSTAGENNAYAVH